MQVCFSATKSMVLCGHKQQPRPYTKSTHMRTSIWFVRHGQTELNKARRYQGITNSPLTPYGQQQAHALAHRLQRIPFRTVIVSPSQRAQETAEIIVAERSIPFVDDTQWAETNHGCWEGLTYVRSPNASLGKLPHALPIR